MAGYWVPVPKSGTMCKDAYNVKSDRMRKVSKEQISTWINGCLKNDRSSQKALYNHFYSYTLSICLYYSANREEADETLNDAFVKVFQQMSHFDKHYPFKTWLRRIIINTAIDSYRRRSKFASTISLNSGHEPPLEPEALDRIAADEILNMVQQLPAKYRLVFNLYVMEGFSHEEISQRLDIHVGTSKSNLFKARRKLKDMLLVWDLDRFEHYG